MQNFRNLAVWQKSHELVLAVYDASANFPQHEAYGLRSQIRRTSIVLPANIAEGSGRGNDQEFTRHLFVANSAAAELDYLCVLAKDLKYIDDAAYEKLSAGVVEVKRMLLGLIKTVKS